MITILVVEDMDTLREEIVETLSFEGFNAIGAENGVIGVQMAHTFQPQLIVCDVAMPELDGYGVLSSLRQDHRTAAIPFVFLTAKTEKADQRRAMQLGADDYLTKPFTIQELLEAIAARLQKVESERNHYQRILQEDRDWIAFQAHHDPLTQLPNHLLFYDSLTSYILHAEQNRRQFALLLVDVDNFNVVNNTLGSRLGDELLKAIAARLRLFFPPCDLVARLRGDEFAVLVMDIVEREALRETVQQLLENLSQSYSFYGHDIFITSTVGAITYPTDQPDADGLIKGAELALYAAKRLGRNAFRIYTPDMKTFSTEAMALANRLHQAVRRDEFRVHYQPQVDLHTGRIVAAEALVRWFHPELGIISPAKFIPIAEEMGLMQRLSVLILRRVCRQVRHWRDLGLNFGRIAVNISGQHFARQEDLVTTIREVLEDTQVAATDLELELTESMIMKNSDSTVYALTSLRRMGFQIAIDDFGTGYSSLAYLKHFPVDVIKIDRCFVTDSPHNPHDAAITTAIIELAHSLALMVVAEGVETPAQQEFLRRQGCDRFQGYLFSPPLEPDAFAALVHGAAPTSEP